MAPKAAADSCVGPKQGRKGAIKNGPIERGRAPEFANQSGSPASAIKGEKALYYNKVQIELKTAAVGMPVERKMARTILHLAHSFKFPRHRCSILNFVV
jgi:hypothetical protein